MLYCSDTTMDVNVKLHSNQWEQLEELEGHQCLVGILTTLPLLDQTSSLLIAVLSISDNGSYRRPQISFIEL